MDRGVTCMFVGYPDEHGSDCYEMYCPNSGHVYKSRDVRWLGRMYYDKTNVNEANDVEVYDWQPVHDMRNESEKGNQIELSDANDEQASRTDPEEADADENIDDDVDERKKLNEDPHENEPGDEGSQQHTRSGRVKVTPRYLSDYALNYVDKLQELTPAEQTFYKEMHELNEIGLIVVDEEFPEVDTALIGVKCVEVWSCDEK